MSYCEKIQKISLFEPDVWNPYFHGTYVFSSLSMCLMAYTIWEFKELQAHPSQLVFLFAMTLAISIMLWAINVYVICPGPGA
jgi:hypothetical protein